ncbi:MAG TPA: hypothetical protein VFX21_16165, partial [Acidimicrobiia bacterium]|nr:hypothetical protein [Acidimicrobiia bacterium]
CLAHLRTAICATHLDVAMLTDHAPHMNEGTIEDALLAAADDELIRDGAGNAYASIVTCEDGHEVVLTVGSENALMPVGLRRHVLEGVTVDELESAYDAETPAAVDEFRAAGALVLVNHTEQRPLDSLRMLAPDGIEIYNIHANLDPRIRSEYLGLDSDFLADLIRLIMPGNGVAPDLLALAFLEENRNDLDKWDALLAEGVRMPGLAGSDAHENAFANPLADGERADSYRRVMRWFSNHMLVDTTLPRPERYEEALAAARFYVAFEAFGSPVGFDFIAETATVTAEMGETVAPGATLRVVAPTLPPDQPRDPAPDIRLRILRSTATGAVEVAAGTGPTLEHVATEPGAYRAEVFILPNHARPYVGARSDLIREHVWIYSNAIHVVPD